MQNQVGLQSAAVDPAVYLTTPASAGRWRANGFFLEYDDARSGGFEPLRYVPSYKLVVLGLVTTKRGALEDPDLLKRRIEEASRYISVDQLCLPPSVGSPRHRRGTP